MARGACGGGVGRSEQGEGWHCLMALPLLLCLINEFLNNGIASVLINMCRSFHNLNILYVSMCVRLLPLIKMSLALG